MQDGGEDIAALNEQLAKVEKGKEIFSDTIAEMKTDFFERMKEIARDMENAVQDMNLADEMYQIGETSPIQIYIDRMEARDESDVERVRVSFILWRRRKAGQEVADYGRIFISRRDGKITIPGRSGYCGIVIGNVYDGRKAAESFSESPAIF